MRIGIVNHRSSLLLILAAACDPAPVTQPQGTVCLAIARPGVVAEIRGLDGKPSANGATVKITRRGRFKPIVDPVKGFGDSPHVVASYDGLRGTIDLHVSKPYHAPVVVQGIEVKGGPCGMPEPVRVAVALNLLPDAPDVRQVVVPAYGYSFGGNMSDRLHALVEAAPGISREVAWLSRDTSVVRLSADGSLTTRCRATPGKTWAVAASIVNPGVRDSIRVEVEDAESSQGCPAT